MAKVEIYTKTVCPYCTAAKELFRSKGVEFIEYNAGEDEKLREEMLARSNGRRTFPEIFINGEHLGGFDDISALDQEGKLDELLSKD